MRQPAPSRSLPQFKTVPCGPWEGMTDTREPAAGNPRRAELLENVYATTTDVGVSLVGVPGFRAVGGGPVGSVGFRAAQWIGQFNTPTGINLSILIMGGQIYSYNHGANTFTLQVSTANLTTATITVSASARIAARVFAE